MSAEEIATKLADAQERCGGLKTEIEALEVRRAPFHAQFRLSDYAWDCRKPPTSSSRSSSRWLNAATPTIRFPSRPPTPRKKTKRRSLRPHFGESPHTYCTWQAYEKAMAAKEAAVMCMENGDFSGAQATLLSRVPSGDTAL